jgi:hypothetical protein
MNDPARLAPPAPGVRELEALLAVAATVTVGPLAIAAGAVLAAVMENRRRVWLVALALLSTAGGILLRAFARRHVLAAATVIHDGHPHRDLRSVALKLLPHLWPVWLCTLTLAPLIALAILRRRGAQRLDLQGGEQQRPRSTARLERRCARRAENERERTSERSGLFLGYKLGGDDLLPTRRGRVALSFPRLEHHLVVAGATGSGKTETVLRLAYSLAATSSWTIVYVDGKGDPQTRDRFEALMAHAGRRVALFPEQRYDGWRGSPEEIANRLLQLIDFAEQGGGTYYRDLAVTVVRLACCTPVGPPASSDELLKRLSQRKLTHLHAGQPGAAQVTSMRPEDIDAIRARYAAFFTTVGGALDGPLNFDEIDSAYFLLDGLRLKYEAGYLARFLVEEFTQWAVGRKPREQRVLLIVDEFSAIAQASQALVHVVERARGFGVSAVLCPQVAEGMGGDEAAARIIGSAQTILLHATAIPSQLVDVAGTRRVYEFAHQLDGDAATGLGSARLQHQYRVDLDEVRRLKVGQCFAISRGLAMKLQIVPAPSHASLPEQPQPDTVARQRGRLARRASWRSTAGLLFRASRP